MAACLCVPTFRWWSNFRPRRETDSLRCRKAAHRERRLMAETASTPRHPGVAVRHCASPADCFRWGSAARIDPEPTKA